MRATLEFDLEDPEQRMAHLRCIKAEDMATVIFEIEQAIRSYEKYGNAYKFDENVVRKIIDDYAINTDELIS